MGGCIRIGGHDIRHMSESQLAQCMSFVFQDNILFSQTVRYNVLLAKPDASEDDMIWACKQAQIHDVIMAMPDGYDTKITPQINLSGGQQQRLCIARALLKNAPILILDEATSHTDAENEFALQQAIGALVTDKTLIVIAHRLSTIMHMDNIGVMDDGQIVEYGTHENLIAQDGMYKTLWGCVYKITTFYGTHGCKTHLKI